jgi:hypothetical protein
MSVRGGRALRAATELVRSRRSSIQVHAGPDLDRPKRMRTANMTCISDRRAACRAAGPHLGAWSTMVQPKAQGQRSIQIDGLHVPCVSLQTAGDQHGLVFRLIYLSIYLSICHVRVQCRRSAGVRQTEVP